MLFCKESTTPFQKNLSHPLVGSIFIVISSYAFALREKVLIFVVVNQIKLPM